MRFVKLFAMSMIGLVTASAAQAQTIGTYKGTTKDGSAVTITVAQDPNSANLEVTVLAFGLSMLCQKSKETISDIGLGLGDGFDITGKTFSYASSNFFYIDLVTNMKFDGRSVKGKVGGNLASFDPAAGHATLTKKTQACVSQNQPFTAVLSDGAVAPKASPAAMTMNDGRSTITIGNLPVR
jgi:hypothetical protein